MLDLLISSIRLPEQNLSDAEIKSKYGSIKQYDLLNARYWAQFFNRLNTVPSNKTTVGRGGSEMNEIIENFYFLSWCSAEHRVCISSANYDRW